MFRKELVPTTVPIAFSVEIESNGDSTTEYARLVHYFKRPSPSLREQLSDTLAGGPRGRKVTPKRTMTALYNFWSRSIDHVEGYDDLPKGVGWKDYFKDDTGLEHVQIALIFLLRRLGGEEEEVTKKSDSLLETS